MMMSQYDNCNTGWRFCQCLKLLGLNVIYFKAKVHPFFYPEQAIVHPILYKAMKKDETHYISQCVDGLKSFSDNSHVIHFRDSMCINTGTDLTNKHVVAQHSGRVYRVYHDDVNKIFNEFVDASLIQMPDLLGLGAKNEHLVYFPVDTDYLRPVFKSTNLRKLLVGHYPTYKAEKGSKMIISVVDKVNGKSGRLVWYGPREFSSAGDHLMIWTEHLMRLAQCDIVIDTIAETVHGKPYGEWGNTTFEAAALGKHVIVNSHRLDIYRREYGTTPSIHIANNAEELEARLREILDMTEKEHLECREKTREWVEKYHGMRPTAERLWDRIYSKFFERRKTCVAA